jgi:hypothetical protein
VLLSGVDIFDTELFGLVLGSGQRKEFKFIKGLKAKLDGIERVCIIG